MISKNEIEVMKEQKGKQREKIEKMYRKIERNGE